MPYLKLQTNQAIDDQAMPGILAALSKGIAEALGKSENYVMITLESAKPMFFAGNDAPAAFVELKSLGLPEERTAQFSKQLCSLIESQTGISKERIYIEFAAPARHMWGWNGRTF
jgi:phenylpyruvate tautomerase